MRRSAQATKDKQNGITGRALMMGGAQATIVGILGLRMRQMQIRDAEQYSMLAENNRISLQLIAPARRRVIDCFGDNLADNRPTYQVTIVCEQAGNMASVLRRLQLLLPMTDSDIAEILKTSETTSAFVPLTVAEDITWEDLSRVAVNATCSMSAIHSQMIKCRSWPNNVSGYQATSSTETP